MSESFPEGDQQQVMVDGVASAGGVCLPFYHVPQQCRREKLRYPNSHDSPPLPPHASAASPIFHYHPPGAVSFSFPFSSSYHMLNTAGSPAVAFEYAGGPSGFNLLDNHSIYEGVAPDQAGHGVSLSLSSSVVSPSHHPQQDHLIGGGAPVRMEPVPAGPFTGYAAILKGSRFLRPAQQMLEEVCGGCGLGILVGDGGDEVEPLDFAAECVGEVDGSMDETTNGELRRKKTRLISMLEEVYRRYRLYFQQIHAVITSFEAVAGLNMAAPYTPLAVKTLAKHFRCMKEAISSQLRFVGESGRDGMTEDISCHNRYFSDGFGFQRTASGSAPINQQPAWRPQRGLPERAVAVLRAWLFEHFLHPYPTDMDKQMLAKQTGLSRNQVSNWFINARVRLWKPMVEEIHSLEQRRRVPDSDDNRSGGKQPDPSSSSFPSPANERTQQPSGSSQKSQEQQLAHKRLQNEFADISGGHVPEPASFALDVPMAGVVAGGGHAGVSLTLGLHQNNGYCLPEQLPLNVARRFGLEDGNMAYVMGGGFEGQERQFGKEFDGQLLRDFVS